MSEQNDKKKKKNNKRAYLNDFELQDNGEYIYKGTIYRYKGDWNKCRHQLWLLCAVFAVLIIAAGSVPADGIMRAFYVILPYGCEVIAAAFLVYAVIRLTSRDEHIREYIYTKTYERFKEYLLFIFIFSTMCLLGEIIHLILNFNSRGMIFSFLFVILQALVFGTGSVFSRTVQAMTFEKVKK